MKRRTFIKTVAAAAVVASMPLAARAAQTHQVTIQGFKYLPPNLPVNVGDTIVFTNQDRVRHTATADDGSWDTGRLRRGESGEIEVTANMGGPYHCTLHRNMRAQITAV